MVQYRLEEKTATETNWHYKNSYKELSEAMEEADRRKRKYPKMRCQIFTEIVIDGEIVFKEIVFWA